MATPESKTKARVKKTLEANNAWYFMPVQGGFGDYTLDFLCARWPDSRFFAIETKKHNADPTDRQWGLINRLRERGTRVFIIDDEADGLKLKHESIAALDAWLKGNHP